MFSEVSEVWCCHTSRSCWRVTFSNILPGKRRCFDSSSSQLICIGTGCSNILDRCFPRTCSRSSRSTRISKSNDERDYKVLLIFIPFDSCSYIRPRISSDEHAQFESLQRNRVSNVSFAVCSAGEILILAVMVGIIKGLRADDSTENNTRTFSVLIAFSGGVWRKQPNKIYWGRSHLTRLRSVKCCVLYLGSPWRSDGRV